MNATRMFRPSASSPEVGRARVGDRVAGGDASTDVDDRALVDARALVASDELREDVLVQLAGVGLDLDPLGGDAGHDPGVAGDQDLAGVLRGADFHARAHDRCLGLEERHGLALHVRAHQGPVGVVVLEERDERGRDRHDLLGRDVHVLDLVRARLGELVAVARRDPLGRGSGRRRRAARSPARRRAALPRRRRGTRSPRSRSAGSGRPGPSASSARRRRRRRAGAPDLTTTVPSLATRSTPAS